MNHQDREKFQPQNIQYAPAQMISNRLQNNEIDILALWNVLWDGKFLLSMILFISIVSATLIVFLIIPQKFRVVSVIRATEASQSIIEAYLGSANFKRKLVNTHNLLPLIFENKWNSATNSWKATDKRDIPTPQQAIESRNFPLTVSIDKRTKLITVFWEAKDPELGAKYLQGSLDVLSKYMEEEYVTDAQTQIEILEQELGPLAQQFDSVWEKFWQLDKISIANTELLRAYTHLKDKLSDLRTKDALSRKFDVLDAPAPPSEPFQPKRTVIIGATGIGSFCFGILVLFIREAIRRGKVGRSVESPCS